MGQNTTAVTAIVPIWSTGPVTTVARDPADMAFQEYGRHPGGDSLSQRAGDGNPLPMRPVSMVYCKSPGSSGPGGWF